MKSYIMLKKYIYNIWLCQLDYIVYMHFPIQVLKDIHLGKKDKIWVGEGNCSLS